MIKIICNKCKKEIKLEDIELEDIKYLNSSDDIICKQCKNKSHHEEFVCDRCKQRFPIDYLKNKKGFIYKTKDKTGLYCKKCFTHLKKIEKGDKDLKILVTILIISLILPSLVWMVYFYIKKEIYLEKIKIKKENFYFKEIKNSLLKNIEDLNKEIKIIKKKLEEIKIKNNNQLLINKKQSNLKNTNIINLNNNNENNNPNKEESKNNIKNNIKEKDKLKNIIKNNKKDSKKDNLDEIIENYIKDTENLIEKQIKDNINSKNYTQKIKSIYDIVHIKEKRLEDILIENLKDKDPFIKILIINALGYIYSEKSVKTLFKLLNSKNLLVRKTLTNTLYILTHERFIYFKDINPKEWELLKKIKEK